MASAKHVLNTQQKLLQLLDSAVCLNQLNDPRLLSCGHVLCRKCLKDYVEKAGHRDRLPCPMCRGLTPLYEGGLDNLPKFFLYKWLWSWIQ